MPILKDAKAAGALTITFEFEAPAAPTSAADVEIGIADETAVEQRPAVRAPTILTITFPNNAPLGIGLKEDGDKVFVSSVEPTSAAAAVPIGSTIKEINGMSLAGKSRDEVLAMVIDAKASGPIVAIFELIRESSETTPPQTSTLRAPSLGPRLASELFRRKKKKKQSTAKASNQSPTTTRLKVTFAGGDAPLGIGLQQRGSNVCLSSVDDHTPASGKVPIGAIVKEINGKSVEGKSKDEIMHLLKDAKAAGALTIHFEAPPPSYSASQACDQEEDAVAAANVEQPVVDLDSLLGRLESTAIQSPARLTITFPNNAPLGIGLKEESSGDVFLSSVEPTSAAAAVPIGSMIKEINGLSVAGLSKDEVLANIIDAKAGGPIVATFEPSRESSGAPLPQTSTPSLGPRLASELFRRKKKKQPMELTAVPAAVTTHGASAPPTEQPSSSGSTESLPRTTTMRTAAAARLAAELDAAEEESALSVRRKMQLRPFG